LLHRGHPLTVASLPDCTRWAALTAAVFLMSACGGGDAGDKRPAPSKSAQTASKKTAQGGATSAKPAATHTPSESDELNKLLTERAWALEHGDAKGFLNTSTGEQATKDKAAIRRARALPINDVQMTAGGSKVDGDRATVRADMFYSFDGLTTQFVKRSRMTVVKTPAGWRVQKDRPTYGELAPWEYATFKARTSRHFLALAPKSLKVGPLMTDLEKGRARMEHKLPGVEPPDRILVIVARTGADTKALTMDYRTIKALTAVAEAKVAFKGPARRVDAVGAQRVFVLWNSYGDRPAKERRMVIAHELTHAALVKRTGGRVPPWLVEGIAMYASGDKRAGDAGALLSGAQLKDSSKQQPAMTVLSLSRLAKPTALERMSAIPLSFAYSYASAAAYAIADKYGGAKALLRLYSAFNSEKIRGKPGRELSDRVMRRTLHASLTTVEADVKAYARSSSAY
jgi:hypothetical protein